ncbi:MAG: phosphodiester glycosidase family protein [Bacillota bacterium]|nr:phosphodiester glycosidase family protein [Bacillota bacterium]
MRIFKKPFVYAALFAALLIAFNVYVLLDTFVFSDVMAQVTEDSKEDSTENGQRQSGKAVITDTSYEDENISISIETIRQSDTTVYVADIKLSSAEYLQTALAENAFGTNVTQKTSEMAEEHDAIFAVNGDYYGANRSGYVIKNGTLYRNTMRSGSEQEDLVVYEDGSFGIVSESQISAEDLIDDGAENLFAFGPVLVEKGTIAVSQMDEVGKAMSGNPRTVIGIIDELHYVIMVSDGRTDESEGLSLYEAAQIMAQYDCETAYNLDGGGSSTMYFNGQIVNNPTTSGRNISEREVSDIVYIGY